MSIGIVGATGQVGGVMRAVLAERDFPVDELRLLRLGPVGRSHLPWRRRRGRRSRTPATADFAGLDIALFSAGGADLAARSPRGSPRPAPIVDRQLVGLAHGPRRAAGRARGQRPRPRLDPQGHRRQPQLHDDGGHAGAQAARPSRPGCARSSVSTYQAVSGAGLAGVGRARRAGPQGRPTAPPALTFDGTRGRLPASRTSSPTPIAFNVIPLAGIARRRRLRRDRRGAEAPQREPQDPRAPRPGGVGHLRAGAGVHRPLAVDQRRVRRGRSRPSRPASCWPRRPASSSPTCPRRSMAAGGDPTFVGRIRVDHDASSTAWRCSSPATTSARAPPSTPSRSPKRSSSAARQLTARRQGERRAQGGRSCVAGDRVVERQAELVGQRRQPGEHVAELVQLLVRRALAHRLGQLADLLAQPGDGGRDAPLGVLARRRAPPSGPGTRRSAWRGSVGALRPRPGCRPISG